MIKFVEKRQIASGIISGNVVKIANYSYTENIDICSMRRFFCFFFIAAQMQSSEKELRKTAG